MKEIKVRLELTEGYQKRYTEACCRALERRAAGLNPPAVLSGNKKKASEKAAV